MRSCIINDLCIINESDNVMVTFITSWALSLVILHEYNRSTVDNNAHNRWVRGDTVCIVNELGDVIQ